ncbi:TadE/TadG family type IV pilus assembly protein [Profundibacter sp.]
MIGFITPLLARVRSFANREKGNATIEFAMFFPMLVTLLLSTVELGILTVRNTLLEHAVDLTVRDLRLGKINQPTQEKIRNLICERSSVVQDCENRLLIELRPVSTVTWTPLASDVICKNRDETINPVVTFDAGASHEMLLVRVCAVFKPVFPSTTLGMQLARDELGGYALVASSAFVNEPT